MQSINEIWKLHGGKNYGFWVTSGARMFLRNFGNILRKDTLTTNKATTRMAKVDLHLIYEGWNFNSGNYLFITDTK